MSVRNVLFYEYVQTEDKDITVRQKVVGTEVCWGVGVDNDST